MNLIKRISSAVFIISLFCVLPLFGEEPPVVESIINKISGVLEASAEDAVTKNDEPDNGSVSIDTPDTGGESFSEEDFEDSFLFDAPELVIEAVPFEGLRFFDEIFPGLSEFQKELVMGSSGIKNAFEKDGSPMMTPAYDSGVNLVDSVMKRKPSHIVEALVVIPYGERELDLLDIYNALGKIKNIQNQQVMVNKVNTNTFTETTRLDNAKNRKPVSDPPPSDTLPFSETLYLKLVDKFIGDLYVRGEIQASLFGITYDMTNFRDVTYFIFSVMKAERFTAIIYVEPVKEGVLIYGMSGMYLPGFIAKKVNITPNMNRRINILISWITEGLAEESKRQREHFYQMPKR